ncbi:MAG: hypothetical protein HON90_01640 [Halobacteriovoraceae bacterium]|nr:hypothetical protein [Halobacteriovoraceae bacterium]
MVLVKKKYISKVKSLLFYIVILVPLTSLPNEKQKGGKVDLSEFEGRYRFGMEVELGALRLANLVNDFDFNHFMHNHYLINTDPDIKWSDIKKARVEKLMNDYFRDPSIVREMLSELRDPKIKSQLQQGLRLLYNNVNIDIIGANIKAQNIINPAGELIQSAQELINKNNDLFKTEKNIILPQPNNELILPINHKENIATTDQYVQIVDSKNKPQSPSKTNNQYTAKDFSLEFQELQKRWNDLSYDAKLNSINWERLRREKKATLLAERWDTGEKNKLILDSDAAVRLKKDLSSEKKAFYSNIASYLDGVPEFIHHKPIKSVNEFQNSLTSFLTASGMSYWIKGDADSSLKTTSLHVNISIDPDSKESVKEVSDLKITFLNDLLLLKSLNIGLQALSEASFNYNANIYARGLLRKKNSGFIEIRANHTGVFKLLKEFLEVLDQPDKEVIPKLVKKITSLSSKEAMDMIDKYDQQGKSVDIFKRIAHAITPELF